VGINFLVSFRTDCEIDDDNMISHIDTKFYKIYTTYFVIGPFILSIHPSIHPFFQSIHPFIHSSIHIMYSRRTAWTVQRTLLSRSAQRRMSRLGQHRHHCRRVVQPRFLAVLSSSDSMWLNLAELNVSRGWDAGVEDDDDGG
jgi:hypothetical protein